MAFCAMRARVGALAAAARPLAFSASRPAAGGAVRWSGTFSEREKGEETVYMRRMEKEQLERLKRLLVKTEEKEADGKAELMEILGEHGKKLPADIINKIIEWKVHD